MRVGWSLSGTPWDAAFSPDGTRLAVAYSDDTVRIWDVSPGALGKEPILILPQDSFVYRVAFSPDGTQLATGNFDGMMRLWLLTDKATRAQKIATLTGSTQEISRVAFSPDGKYVASVSWDGSLRVYLTHVEDLVAIVKTRITRSLTREECQEYLHMDQCPVE